MIAAVLPWLLALAFAGAGAANLAGVGSVRADFRDWGYPPGFHRVTGGLEVLGAALLLLPATRGIGFVLLGAIMAAALATLVLHRATLAHLAPALALAAVLALGAWLA